MQMQITPMLLSLLSEVNFRYLFSNSQTSIKSSRSYLYLSTFTCVDMDRQKYSMPMIKTHFAIGYYPNFYVSQAVEASVVVVAL